MAAIYAVSNGNTAIAADLNQYKSWLVDGSAVTTSPLNVANTAKFVSTTATQLTVGYDSSSQWTVNVLSTGEVQITTTSIGVSSYMTILVKTGLAPAYRINDGTNSYYIVDARTGVSGINAHEFWATGPSWAGAAGNSWILVHLKAVTITQTGSTGVTAFNGLMLNIDQPTVTDSSSLTVTTASTVYIAGAPIAGGSVTLTNPYALHVASGASNFAGQLNVSSGGLHVTAVTTQVAFGATIVSELIDGTITLPTNDSYATWISNETVTSATSGTHATVTAIKTGNMALTVASGGTITRLTQGYFGGISPTVTGTLTNNNAIYATSPSGGTTVKVIDTNAGGGTPAFLSTAGSWTNASSWKAGKVDLISAPREEIRGYLDLLAAAPQPQWYRFPRVVCGDPESDDHQAGVCACRGGHQDYEHPTLFHLLDDLPAEIRRVICTDESGGIGTKDTDGFLLACVQELARQVYAPGPMVG